MPGDQSHSARMIAVRNWYTRVAGCSQSSRYARDYLIRNLLRRQCLGLFSGTRKYGRIPTFEPSDRFA